MPLKAIRHKGLLSQPIDVLRNILGDLIIHPAGEAAITLMWSTLPIWEYNLCQHSVKWQTLLRLSRHEQLDAEPIASGHVNSPALGICKLSQI